MEFFLLGPVQASEDGRLLTIGGPKVRALLAILLINANHVVSRSRIIECLWGDRAPATAGHVVETYISELRSAIDSRASIQTRSPGYVLLVEPHQIDLYRFESAAREGREALDAGDPDRASALLRSALEVFRGEALADLDSCPFVQTEGERLNEARLGVVEDRIDADLILGTARDIIPELKTLVDQHPYRERFRAQLMLALYRSGRQAEALDLYRRFRRFLVEELGVEPGGDLRRLEQAILRQDPSLDLVLDERPLPTSTPDGSNVGEQLLSGRVPRKLSIRAITAVAGVMAVLLLVGIGASLIIPESGGIKVGTGLAIIDPSDGEIIGTVELPFAPGGIAAGEGAVWASNFEGHSIARIDPQEQRVVQTIEVGSGPGSVTAGGGSVWVTNTFDGTVSRIDAATNKVTQTIPVGEGPSSLAFDGRRVWVANLGSRTVVAINARSGRVTDRLGLSARPTGIAAADGRVWVSSELTGAVFEFESDLAQPAQINVGAGPTSLALGHSDLWVANSLDGTVSRVDPESNSVVETIPVGGAVTDVLVTGTSVWSANEFEGTLSEVDLSAGRTARKIAVRDHPRDLAVFDGQLWVSTESSGEAHRGGTLRVLSTHPSFDSIDPAAHQLLSPAHLLGITNDGLVTLKHVGGSDGLQLVPDLALSLPNPTNGGRTYSFQLRPGIRYSDGGLLRPEDFRRAIERDFAFDSWGAAFYKGIVGAHRCVSRRLCDLSEGIVTDNETGTVAFHLVKPDPDFLYKLALPFAYAIPPGTPAPNATDPVPATGPYMIQRYIVGRRMTLVRNPYFRVWSEGAQPDGYVDRIEWTLNVDPDKAVDSIESGAADYAVYDVPFSPPSNRLKEILTRHAGQVRVNSTPALEHFILNTRQPPFDDVRARKALNYAIDRQAVSERLGGPLVAPPTCQVLPPGMPGYQPYCPYTDNDDPQEGYEGPDMVKARRLVKASGTRGMRVNLLTDPHVADTQFVVSALRALGYRVNTLVVGGGRYNALASNSGNSIQISRGGTEPDYPAASNIFVQWLSCDSYSRRSNTNTNRAGFCSPKIDALMQRALRMEDSNARGANELWSEVDRRVVDQAPWLPLVNLRHVDFVSKRVGNYRFHPEWGMLVDQLWVAP